MAQQKLIQTMAKLITDANKKSGTKDDISGSCSYTDLNGDDYCADQWSELQCQQVNGTWTEGGTCEDAAKKKR